MKKTKQNKIRVYKRKKEIRQKTNEEIQQDELKKKNRYEAISGRFLQVGIIAEDEKKAMNCLLYRFRAKNIYYNLLVNIYLQDNSKFDFLILAWLVVKSCDDKTDYKKMYKQFQLELETETNVTKRQKQKQIFKQISLECHREKQKDVSVNCKELEEVEKRIDYDIVALYIEQHCTKEQKNALQKHINDNKKIDSRQKKRILEKLATVEFKQLLI